MKTALPDGQFALCSLVAIDVVGHSGLVLSLSNKKTEELFGEIERRVRGEVEHAGGLLLGWQGDGGIAIFPAADPADDEARARAALRTAEMILTRIPVISAQHALHDDDRLHVRVAVHSGGLIWRQATGSIHSADVNFVAHLEHALPNDVIGVSAETYKALPTSERACCASVGTFENHGVFIYARDPAHRQSATAAYEEKRNQSQMGRLCIEDGLVHFEFRDAHHKKLAPTDIYGQAKSEILISGVTLATSFKQDDMLRTLRAFASEGNARLRLLVLDPHTIGAPFATGIDSIEETMSALRDELASGRFGAASTELRGMLVWPHFTGIMIDGDVEGLMREPMPSGPNPTLLLRVQATIPPDTARHQHFAPVFMYKRAFPSSTMMAYMRGFRYYWQNARKLL